MSDNSLFHIISKWEHHLKKFLMIFFKIISWESKNVDFKITLSHKTILRLKNEEICMIKVANLNWKYLLNSEEICLLSVIKRNNNNNKFLSKYSSISFMLQHTCCVNYHAISLDNSLKLSTGSRPEVPCKKCVLKNFAKFAGKTSVPETLCRLKVAGLRNFMYKLPHKLLIRLNKT